ncbi:MAG TPA: hypothetical protein VGZ04_08295 [Acidimicrobiales bacterium]|nr:hypothetical protein [Acidimicrobiales bacterium]
MVHASALLLLSMVTVLAVTAQRAFGLFHNANVASIPPRVAPTRGATRHVLTIKNARSTRRERRNHPTISLII